MRSLITKIAVSLVVLSTLVACGGNNPDETRVVSKGQQIEVVPDTTAKIEGHLLGAARNETIYKVNKAVLEQHLAEEYLKAEAARQEANRQAAIRRKQRQVAPKQKLTPPSSSYGSGRCGGNLPPCYVVDRESKGQIDIYNTQGSGASGKYQFMPETWNGYGGYANAADAPESVQDAKAEEVWAGGAGCSHWSSC